jgi:hypothetical protein
MVRPPPGPLSTKKPAWRAGFLVNDDAKTDYFLSIVALSSLAGFFVLVFFVVLFMALIELWSVPAAPVALVWVLAGAPGFASVAVCAEAAAMADKPMTAAQTDVSMVFRMEVSWLKRPMQNRAVPGLFLLQANG